MKDLLSILPLLCGIFVGLVLDDFDSLTATGLLFTGLADHVELGDVVLSVGKGILLRVPVSLEKLQALERIIVWN